MKVEKYILSLILTIIIVSCCQSQSMQYRNRIRPKVKAKLDSLYPQATSNIVLNDKYVSDTTQEININCHCEETTDMITLVFDTNGKLRYKEVHYTSIKNLPDTIVSYMKENASDTVKFINNYMIKSINNRGEILYGIIVYKTPHSWIRRGYILWFKSSGELISKEEIPPATG